MQVDLAQLSEAYQREKDKLARIEESRCEVAARLLAYEAESPLNLHLINLTYRFLGSLRDDEADQLAVVEELARQVENKRQELVKVMQEKKVLEKLKERYLAELDEAARLREFRTSDEIGTNLHHLSLSELTDTGGCAIGRE